jgi:hypothetical protein
VPQVQEPRAAALPQVQWHQEQDLNYQYLWSFFTYMSVCIYAASLWCLLSAALSWVAYGRFRGSGVVSSHLYLPSQSHCPMKGISQTSMCPTLWMWDHVCVIHTLPILKKHILSLLEWIIFFFGLTICNIVFMLFSLRVVPQQASVNNR